MIIHIVLLMGVLGQTWNILVGLNVAESLIKCVFCVNIQLTLKAGLDWTVFQTWLPNVLQHKSSNKLWNPHRCWSRGATPATEINRKKNFLTPLLRFLNDSPCRLSRVFARLVWRVVLHSLGWLMENPFILHPTQRESVFIQPPCDLVLAGPVRKSCP